IDEIRKNYQSLENLRRADQGLISSTVEFLRQTELGRKMLDAGGTLLEIGRQPVFEPATGKYRSAAAEFVNDLVDSSRAKGLTVVQVLGSAAMWTEVINNVRTARSNADLAIALGRTLVNNTFFGMVLNSAYAGIVMGDNQALGKAVMYMLVPEAALPALVEALGNSAISLGAQTLFDAQMTSVYGATTFKNGEIADFGALGIAGTEGARYFVDTLCDGAPEAVAQDLVNKARASNTATGLNAVAIRAIARSVRSTVDNGHVLVFTEDGPLRKAAAAIAGVTEDITDCAKAWGVEIPLFASNAGDLPGGLDGAQTRALVRLMERRERARLDARAALTDAIVRTFVERNRAETALDSGKANAQYQALLKIFEQLGILKEGQASLDAEGAPYTLFTKWLTSTRERQMTAMRAVQHFTEAYTTVLQARARAEEAARANVGEEYTPAPRPLTRSLPLTANPDMDLRIAAAYVSEVGRIAHSLVSVLEAIKKSRLEGSYDADMFSQVYKVRFGQAYASAMMQAARDAQDLHWATEVFDKQALYEQHSQWAAESSRLQKRDTALLDEFREHYAVRGEYVVSLSGPAEITSGTDATLEATVTIRGKAGDIQLAPPDIAQQFRYAWTAGTASLGGGPEASKSYRLDTVGTHTFHVRVTQTVTEAGKPVVKVIGESSWSVKVVAVPEKPEKPGKPERPETPPEEKPAAGKAPSENEKPPTEKLPPEKPGTEKPAADKTGGGTTPPSAGTSGKAAGAAASAASGYWTLVNVVERRYPSSLLVKDLSNERDKIVQTYTSTSSTSRVFGTYMEVDPKRPSGERFYDVPFDYSSTASWSGLPQVIPTDATVTVSLNLTWTPLGPKIKVFGDEWIYAYIDTPGDTITVSPGHPSASGQWSFARNRYQDPHSAYRPG
ncbi:MAG: hypothetical protein IMZ67_01310, partial [Acidobacteria bacterium]|nr:hypothetical protein [Acidobacteriota bacterium]